MTVHNLPQHFNSSVPPQSYEQAYSFVAALTQSDPDRVLIDARCFHDANKPTAAIPRRGTLRDLWSELCAWNNVGFGVFLCINEMDGSGRYEIANVKTIRCQAVDLDNLSAQQNYERAAQFNPPPSFAVQSSPGKLHIYWQTQHHTDRNKFTLLQRKLIQHFDGDKTVIDPSRVLRLPGFLHLKTPEQPHLVTCWSLSGYGRPIAPGMLEIALARVPVIDGTGGRHPLGEASLQAPSLDLAMRALNAIDPNTLDRGNWISVTSAFKQAAGVSQRKHSYLTCGHNGARDTPRMIPPRIRKIGSAFEKLRLDGNHSNAACPTSTQKLYSANASLISSHYLHRCRSRKRRDSWTAMKT
ncbi:DNA-primase RepB domain-containing protein [Bradyrhizobium sp. USDA 3240]